MKIVNRKTFLALPPDTVFSKYEPCYFEEIRVKGDTLPSDDFIYSSIPDAIECRSSEEFSAKLFDSQENDKSMAMDFDNWMRDGCFDQEQLFAIWEARDVEALIAKLRRCLIPKSEIEIPTLCK